jgi:hypothetical protein
MILKNLLFGEIVFDEEYTKLKKHLIVFLMMMILIMVKYKKYLMCMFNVGIRNILN